jgi:hypothetical protein
MATVRKPAKGLTGKKPVASSAGRVLAPGKKARKSGVYELIGSSQLRQADQLLTRIERKGEALSASADKLLRRVS